MSHVSGISTYLTDEQLKAIGIELKDLSGAMQALKEHALKGHIAEKIQTGLSLLGGESVNLGDININNKNPFLGKATVEIPITIKSEDSPDRVDQIKKKIINNMENAKYHVRNSQGAGRGY